MEHEVEAPLGGDGRDQDDRQAGNQELEVVREHEPVVVLFHHQVDDGEVGNEVGRQGLRFGAGRGRLDREPRGLEQNPVLEQEVLVVETQDALLICRRGRSQDVRKIVAALEAKGALSYL